MCAVTSKQVLLSFLENYFSSVLHEHLEVPWIMSQVRFVLMGILDGVLDPDLFLEGTREVFISS